MFISIFKSNHRIVALFVLFLTAALCIPFFRLDEQHVRLGYAWLDYLALIGLVGFQATYFNRLVNREKLVENNTYLTSLMVVFINSAAFILINLSEVIVANTFVVLCLHQLFKIYNEKYKMAGVFNAAVLMGIAASIYQPYVIGLLVVFVLMFYLTTPVWRDVAVLIIGFVVPQLYVLVYHFYVGGLEALNIGLLDGLKWGQESLQLTLGSKVFLGSIALLAVLAMPAFIKAITHGVVKVRKLLWSIVFVGLFGCTTYLLNGGNLIELLVALVLPVAVLLANFFERMKHRWISESLFALVLVGMGWLYFS